MSLLLYEDTKFDPKKPEPYNKRIGIDAKEYARFLNHYYEFKEEEHPITPETSFTVLVEAIHADMPTRNYTRYKKSSFRGAIPTWSTVYRHMPVIMYHNDYNGQIIGRVIEAYEDKAVRSEAEGLKADALMLRIAVPDWRMENQIRNGILDSVSIGASATDVRCSICGEQL